MLLFKTRTRKHILGFAFYAFSFLPLKNSGNKYFRIITTPSHRDLKAGRSDADGHYKKAFTMFAPGP